MFLPQPSGEFEWVQASWGAALRCKPLAAVAAHYFSTRQDSPEQTLAHALGVHLDDLIRMKQVHRADVFVATGRPAEHPQADIAVTTDPSIALSVRVADCVPILLADRRTGAVAAVHAGWKGTAAGAALAAVRAMTERYQTRPEDLIAAVGPSIGPCCYEVGPDLAREFSLHADAPAWFTSHAKSPSAQASQNATADRPHLDLWRATRDQLARAGVPPHHIHVCALCTFDHPALFHSYRRDGAKAGRVVAAIRSAPGRTP